MAHSISARKRVRQNEKRRMRNRTRRTVLKNETKVVREQLLHGTADKAADALKVAVRELDRAANRGTIHRNAAARRKSRLTKRLNAARAKTGAAS